MCPLQDEFSTESHSGFSTIISPSGQQQERVFMVNVSYSCGRCVYASGEPVWKVVWLWEVLSSNWHWLQVTQCSVVETAVPFAAGEEQEDPCPPQWLPKASDCRREASEWDETSSLKITLFRPTGGCFRDKETLKSLFPQIRLLLLGETPSSVTAGTSDSSFAHFNRVSDSRIASPLAHVYSNVRLRDSRLLDSRI
ncbi:hypothetical protein KM043_012705 [Ampulex compressa]|nr:hypothetical protein KM043_012705 [Ampulex compressa]